jgi:hypothetical protein
MELLQDILIPLILALVAAIGSIIVWVVRSKTEESRATRIKLDEERRKTYSEILSPYIRILVDSKNREGAAKALKEIKSFDYKKTAFELTLFGSDNVVRAYNAFLQYAYKAESDESDEQRAIGYMRLWGQLLLEIRKDVGNKKTGLNERDMLRWLIRDIDKLE